MHQPRNDHPNLEELTAFDRGQLQSVERDAVERHVADCDTCIRAVAFCPDGRRILSVDDGGVFRFWHLP